jgi:hypothetical protein
MKINATILGVGLYVALACAVGALTVYSVFSQKHQKDLESKVQDSQNACALHSGDINNDGHAEHYFDLNGDIYIRSLDKSGNEVLVPYAKMAAQDSNYNVIRKNSSASGQNAKITFVNTNKYPMSSSGLKSK